MADPLLANRWVGAPPRAAIPDCALGEVHFAHHSTVLEAHPKHIRVALLAIAGCASNRYPALLFREARREAGAKVLRMGWCVGDLVQARAVGVDPVEVCGTLLALGQAAEEHQLAVGGELRVILAVQLPWRDPMSILWRARRTNGLDEHRMTFVSDARAIEDQHLAVG